MTEAAATPMTVTPMAATAMAEVRQPVVLHALRVGGAGLFGLSYPDLLAAASTPKAKARATAKADGRPGA